MLKRGISYNACLFAVTGLLDSLLMLGLQNSLSPFLEKTMFWKKIFHLFLNTNDTHRFRKCCVHPRWFDVDDNT